MTPLPHPIPDLVGPDPPCVDMRCVQYTRVLEGADKFGFILRLRAVGIAFWGGEGDQRKVKCGIYVYRLPLPISGCEARTEGEGAVFAS